MRCTREFGMLINSLGVRYHPKLSHRVLFRKLNPKKGLPARTQIVKRYFHAVWIWPTMNEFIRKKGRSPASTAGRHSLKEWTWGSTWDYTLETSDIFAIFVTSPITSNLPSIPTDAPTLSQDCQECSQYVIIKVQWFDLILWPLISNFFKIFLISFLSNYFINSLSQILTIYSIE